MIGLVERVHFSAESRCKVMDACCCKASWSALAGAWLCKQLSVDLTLIHEARKFVVHIFWSSHSRRTLIAVFVSIRIEESSKLKYPIDNSLRSQMARGRTRAFNSSFSRFKMSFLHYCTPSFFAYYIHTTSVLLANHSDWTHNCYWLFNARFHA